MEGFEWRLLGSLSSFRANRRSTRRGLQLFAGPEIDSKESSDRVCERRFGWERLSDAFAVVSPACLGRVPLTRRASFATPAPDGTEAAPLKTPMKLGCGCGPTCGRNAARRSVTYSSRGGSVHTRQLFVSNQGSRVLAVTVISSGTRRFNSSNQCCSRTKHSDKINQLKERRSN
jgi:hypothetical protein